MGTDAPLEGTSALLLQQTPPHTPHIHALCPELFHVRPIVPTGFCHQIFPRVPQFKEQLFETQNLSTADSERKYSGKTEQVRKGMARAPD